MVPSAMRSSPTIDRSIQTKVSSTSANVAAAGILLGTSRRSSKTYFFIFFFLAFFTVVFFAFFAFLAMCPSVKYQMSSLTAQTGIGLHTRKRTTEFARLTLRRLVRDATAFECLPRGHHGGERRVLATTADSHYVIRCWAIHKDTSRNLRGHDLDSGGLMQSAPESTRWAVLLPHLAETISAPMCFLAWGRP